MLQQVTIMLLLGLSTAISISDGCAAFDSIEPMHGFHPWQALGSWYPQMAASNIQLLPMTCEQIRFDATDNMFYQDLYYQGYLGETLIMFPASDEGQFQTYNPLNPSVGQTGSYGAVFDSKLIASDYVEWAISA